MMDTAVELLIIAGTLLCAGRLLQRDALKARRVYALALTIAVCIAFCVAQGAAAAGMLSVTLAFSPIEALSLIAMIYWISFIAEKGKPFNRILGE